MATIVAATPALVPGLLLQLAEVDGRPVGHARVQWTDENRGDRVHSAALLVTADALAGSFAALLDWIIARHLDVARASGAEA